MNILAIVILILGQFLATSFAKADTAFESLYQCTLKQTVEMHPGSPETIYQSFLIYGPLTDGTVTGSAFPATITALQTFNPNTDTSAPDTLFTGTIHFGSQAIMGVPLDAVFTLNIEENGFTESGTWTINTDGKANSTVEVKSNDPASEIPLSEMTCEMVNHQKQSVGAHN